MTDRELLELAAKAAGIEYDAELSKPHPVSGAWWGLWLVYHREPHEFDRRYWNPLTDDGEALRLAVKLEIIPAKHDDTVVASRSATWRSGSVYGSLWEPAGSDPYAATRRAIVRAAAEIGKAMP